VDLNKLTIKEAHEGLIKKNFSCVELIKSCLGQIKKRDKDINAFITVNEKDALERAKDCDNNFGNIKDSILFGIPFSAKDAICTKDVRSTASGLLLDNYVPSFDATVIKKIKEKGAILIGKNNCDSWGHGASNENSMYGPVKNPIDETKVSGGSSGGSAASVAANMAIFSIGEDTGGSVRQPASFCGIVGMRPSYGRNSRYGIMPMASSLDTVGPLAKTVEDIAILMEIMAGKDPKDATTVPDKVPKYASELKKNIKGLKVGIPKEYFELEGMDHETKQIVEKKISDLSKIGCKVKEVSLPYTKYAIPTYYIIVPSEDSSNLGRLDGIRYGVRKDATDLYGVYAESRVKGFPDEVKRRIMMGTYSLSAGYYDAYYRKAQKVRTLIKQDFEDAFKDCDILITPTSPYPAFNLGEKKDDVLAMYLADVFVSPASLAGVPAMSVPAGKTKLGLPVGLHIIGPRLGESIVLRAGFHIEQLTNN
jgi:aspartyl-tRNA(Asn)/glutamyl-tRNA(Gln) amidotransferase subunit A